MGTRATHAEKEKRRFLLTQRRWSGIYLTPRLQKSIFITGNGR
jgi:hypothetical protein